MIKYSIWGAYIYIYMEVHTHNKKLNADYKRVKDHLKRFNHIKEPQKKKKNRFPIYGLIHASNTGKVIIKYFVKNIFDYLF